MTGRGLYEREEFTAQAEQALDALCEGHRRGRTDLGGMLLYSGPAGIGKTSLLAQLRRSAVDREQPCTVLYARGGERSREAAFHVVRQLLQPALAKLDDRGRTELIEASQYDLVAPALGLVAPTVNAPSDPQGVRDALDWMVSQLAVRNGPLLVIVDDVHWADIESLNWLTSFATGRVAGLPVLLAAAFRPEEMPSEAEPLLAPDSIGCILQLHDLSPAAVEELVRNELGEDADDMFCRQCWSITAGNPYELGALVAKLKDRQLAPINENAGQLRELVAAGRGPAIARRLEKYGPDTYRFAYALAVLDNAIDPDIAARVAVITPSAAATAIQWLREERLIKDETLPDGRIGLGFVHPTIATAIYQSMLFPNIRTAMHGKAAAEVIDNGGSMAAASRHLMELYPDDDQLVVRQLRQAAREHLAVGAPDTARRCLERALQEPPADEDRAEVLFELGCSALLTDLQATINHLRAAMEASPGLSTELREQATLRLGQALGHSNQMAEAAEVTAVELARTEPGLGRTRLQAAYFMWRAFLREEPDGLERSRRLAELSESLTGTDSGSRAVRVMRAFDLTLRGEESAQVLALTERAFDRGRLAEGIGWTNTVWGFEIPVLIGLTYIYNDRLDLAIALFNQAADEYEVAGWSGGHLAFVNLMRGLALCRWGRLDDAENFLRDTLRKSDRLGRNTPLQWDIVAALCDTLMARGQLDEAVQLAEDYSFKPPFPPVMVVPDAPTLYGRLLLAQGRRKEAAIQLEESGRQLDAKDWHYTVWAPWSGPLAVAIADEDPQRARALTAEALKRAERIGTNSAVGTALRWCAAVAEPGKAVGLLRQAVERLGQSPAAYEHTLALVDLGAALRRAGRPREAADALEQGIQLAAQCGADGLVIRGRAELQASGTSPDRLHAIALRVLNEQERAVAELAAVGVPTQRIAQELDITEKAASRLLASAYRKVGTGPDGLSAVLGLD
ncbi:AAA family ATPase [Streptacidiphilus sp. EB129]|uniref:helix-turn-helix transcriptional regulator n=1 Tax=Streptacidiphilus sp. EB129 TaxID=3156262 RepID=UPI003515B509